MFEQWRPVVGFEGLYEVSDQGRVRSLARISCQLSRTGNTYERLVPGQILATRINVRRGGYRYTGLCVGTVKTTRRVAVLVAQAFVGPRPDGLEVTHKNGIAADDRADNLVYKTHRDNVHDSIRHGTFLRGEAAPWSRLTEDSVRAIRAAAGNVSQSVIAERFGVCRPHISDIVNRKKWAHVA